MFAVSNAHNFVGTTRVDVYRCQDREFGTFWLIDTPGFDDTYRADADVLREIANWLNQAYVGRIKLTGILYVHPIRENRMAGRAIDSVRSFIELCGTEALRKVVLVTTFWDTVDSFDGARRELELRENPDFWQTMLSNGSQVFRHENKLSTARAVIGYLLGIRTAQDQGTYLKIQHQMVDDKMSLHQTGAGSLMLDALEKQRIMFEKELEELQADLQRAIDEQNEAHRVAFDELRRVAEDNRARVARDKRRIDANYESLKRLIAQRDALEAAEEEQQVEEQEEHLRRLHAELRDLREQEAHMDRDRQLRDELAERQRKIDEMKWRRRQREQVRPICNIL